MPEKIFINYRRETDRDAAGRLRDRLETAFSEEGVFIDVDMRPGRNFVVEISASIAQCDIFLCVIGPNWAEVKDRESRRRLENPRDWVRIELEAALRQKKTIIPVLIHDAEMPSALRLPDTLAALAEINAARLTHERYGVDVRGLIGVIKDTRAEASARTERDQESEGLKSEGLTKPDWASAIGRDNFGLWTEISVGDAKQRMRWIAPGKFWMGSAKSEKDAETCEGPQHEVTISQGFWLFDTACTQALWQAVMGNNSSRFKGPDRPVENVSWSDAQDFLRRTNGRVPGLALSLPSEAQWEYACRAGTTTPFSFGENITPKQVNYNGNAPFAGVAEGLYRGETVSVGSLPANAWGLYEMHGNVWEWCADAWHGNYEGAPTDGSAWESEEAAWRVLRGGSWSYFARSARSAYREGFPPSERVNIGFRCARVQG